MNRILLFVFFTSTFLCSQAQWVNIPDSNFGKWLTTTYPTCMQGDPQVGFQMDTSCGGILNEVSLNCSGQYISSIFGIQYFKRLTNLECRGNNLVSIPVLPDSLETIDVGSNKLDSISNLPNSLKYLYCENNGLTFLPILPDSLLVLFCNSNFINKLPSLPSKLSGLYCAENPIDTLPSLPNTLTVLVCLMDSLKSLPLLPNTLVRLLCSYNKLSSLPNLPNSLTDLFCDENLITSLPSLPSSLEYLHFGSNHVTQLISIPNSLKSLSCYNNPILNLPTLPNTLTSLVCSNDSLTSLPNLPNTLKLLDCGSNNISTLPPLPKSISDLWCGANPNLRCIPSMLGSMDHLFISNTAISCLPNRFSFIYSDINPNLLPLCDILSGCAFYYNIGGNVHQKTTTDCIQDSLLPGMGLSNIKLQLQQNGQTVQQTYAYSLGEYSFNTDSNTNYVVQIDTIGLPLIVTCPNSFIRNIVLTNADSIKLNQNFGLECKGVDVGILSIQSRFRAGRTNTVSLVAGDIIKEFYKANCSNNIGGIVVINFSGPVNYVGPALGALTPSTISGNTLSYSVSDFSTLPSSAFNFVLATDTHAVIGSSICISVTVSTASDINLSNNSLSQCFIVVNSYDPNVKEVFPQLTNSRGEWLTYTVHFQNTGNDTAYDVVVRDTLSNFVDANSFQFLASSQEQKIIQIKGNAVAFTFPNINLVDSATNPDGSIGWFQFRVKAKPNLPPQTAIENTAFIYFDFNPAVVTNTATTTVCSPSFSSITDTLCGQSIFFNGGYLTQQGTYYDTLTNTTGCDSIITIVLISKQNSSTIFDSICSGSTKAFNGQILSLSGIYYDTLVNVLGCDSFISLHLFARPNSTTVLYDSICNGDAKVFNGQSLTQSDLYNDTLINGLGCDSIITLNLYVKSNPTKPIVIRNGSQLSTSARLNHSYSWYLNSQPLIGQTDTSIQLTQNGNYYVTIFGPNSCTSSSAIFSVNNLGIVNIANANFNIYPNPNNGSFTLHTTNQIGQAWQLTDVLGRPMAQGVIEKEYELIQLKGSNAGVYIFTCAGQQIRLIVE